jgi:hypothetical protein
VLRACKDLVDALSEYWKPDSQRHTQRAAEKLADALKTAEVAVAKAEEEA